MALSQRRAQLIARLRSRKTRERESLVLVEGIRGAGEALAARADARFAVVSPRLGHLAEGSALLARLADEGVELVEEDDAALQELSDTEQPQGVLLICREPLGTPQSVRGGGRYLLLDGIQDPGNVGTLIRAATAFGLEGVVALDGSADPWGAKAVRASAGMAFRIPILKTGAGEALALLRTVGVPLLVADAGGEDVGSVPVGGGWALAVGNEGSGPREEVVMAAARTVRVPMPGPAESLNAGVAGSILLYALTREGRVDR